MSKRIVKHKTARFTLEPDGFSIHTIELSMEISYREFQRIKDQLYRQQEQSGGKPWIYKDSCGIYVCLLFSGHGINSIRLEHNQLVGTYYLRMVVNPRKLIDPRASYIGILPPEKSSVKKLKKAFSKLFQNTVFENSINAYQLTRVDLCTNIRCNSNRLFRELVRVLRKLPDPPKYERRFYKHENKKEANRYNKHYLRFHCKTKELVIYDKTYQVRNGNLAVGYENLPEGVLRFEIHCERDYIRKLETQFGTDVTTDMLWRLMQESERLIVDHFSRCFSDARFLQMDDLTDTIMKSAFKEKNKVAMLELVDHLQRTQSVDKALKKMERAGYSTDGLLDRFDKLGIRPIPLRKNFCSKELPGMVELLRAVSSQEIILEYIEVKYK